METDEKRRSAARRLGKFSVAAEETKYRPTLECIAKGIDNPV